VAAAPVSTWQYRAVRVASRDKNLYQPTITSVFQAVYVELRSLFPGVLLHRLRCLSWTAYRLSGGPNQQVVYP